MKTGCNGAFLQLFSSPLLYYLTMTLGKTPCVPHNCWACKQRPGMASIAHLDRPPSFAVGEGLPPQGPTPRLLNGVGVSPPAGPEPGACWPSPRPVAWGGVYVQSAPSRPTRSPGGQPEPLAWQRPRCAGRSLPPRVSSAELACVGAGSSLWFLPGRGGGTPSLLGAPSGLNTLQGGLGLGVGLRPACAHLQGSCVWRWAFWHLCPG